MEKKEWRQITTAQKLQIIQTVDENPNMKRIDIARMMKIPSSRRKSPRISRFSLFLCFDKIAFTNSSDVTKDAKISDKVLCYTFIKLLEQSRILSNWRKQALNDHSRRNKLLRWDFKVHIRSRSSSTPIRPLSLYRPLRA
ncbi:hypothetical protein T03_9228, partial [Trichinella britovi]